MPHNVGHRAQTQKKYKKIQRKQKRNQNSKEVEEGIIKEDIFKTQKIY